MDFEAVNGHEGTRLLVDRFPEVLVVENMHCTRFGASIALRIPVNSPL